jgi:hypothetical protein
MDVGVPLDVAAAEEGYEEPAEVSVTPCLGMYGLIPMFKDQTRQELTKSGVMEVV